MSSRREHRTYTTGAHRAHRRTQGPGPGSAPRRPQRPPARYEPYLDGLFTYCLSVLCEHEAATDVLGEVLAVAERQHGRRPADGECRAWLYALARWACLRHLAEKGRSRGGPSAAGGSAPSEAVAERQRRELAALAWPEAAGITPEQREALELAVRHQLSPHEVAAVLGLEREAARALLSSAACEVERTRAALVVVERGNCPVVARLTGDNQVLLGTALRRELVRHVDECADCRRTAERAAAGGPWPGSSTPPGTLPVLEAPRPSAHAAMVRALRDSPSAGARGGPRFNRDGFPLDPRDRAARRRRLRSRMVTTTVVATVVAAPVLALWTAYRGAPLTGEAQDAGSVSASESGVEGIDGHPYQKAGNAEIDPGGDFTAGRRSPDVSVEVIEAGGGRHTRGTGRTPSAGAPGTARSTAPGRPGRPSAGHGPGRLTVDAQPSGDVTLVRLSASGGSPVRWSAYADAAWLQLDRTSGVLRPGESVTITVSVDHAREPAGPWRARIAVDPAGAVVSVQGRGASPEPTPTPSDPEPTPSPTPSDSSPPPSDSPSPSQSPSPSG